jgi:hypothetical protein
VYTWASGTYVETDGTTFMVAPCILESSIDYLSPINAVILTLFNGKYKNIN